MNGEPIGDDGGIEDYTTCLTWCSEQMIPTMHLSREPIDYAKTRALTILIDQSRLILLKGISCHTTS
jgi:hypothetical protein